jgi:hypothetical protein
LAAMPNWLIVSLVTGWVVKFANQFELKPCRGGESPAFCSYCLFKLVSRLSGEALRLPEVRLVPQPLLCCLLSWEVLEGWKGGESLAEGPEWLAEWRVALPAVRL